MENEEISVMKGNKVIKKGRKIISATIYIRSGFIPNITRYFNYQFNFSSLRLNTRHPNVIIPIDTIPYVIFLSLKAEIID